MLFPQLLLLPSNGPSHLGTWQMALDEALLRTTSLPLLRFYRWAERTVTFGYFMKRDSFSGLAPASVPRVRRWTGGGGVDHDGDLPYSIIVPAGHSFNSQRPAASYEAIHGCLAKSLRECGISALLAPATAGLGAECFRNPVAADVLLSGRKISGAGQRRSRFGLLHQGAIQGVAVDETRLINHFARQLAGEILPMEISPATLELAEIFHFKKYATREWEYLR